MLYRVWIVVWILFDEFEEHFIQTIGPGDEPQRHSFTTRNHTF